MTISTFARATLTCALLVTPALAQTVEKKSLSLDGAKTILAACEAEASRLKAGGAIAVVDDGGNLIALHRIDGTFAAASNVSIGKARTAAMFRKPTGAFEQIIRDGRTPMLALSDFTPLQGGVPIIIAGQVVGAVGMSGAASAQQDEDIAKIGVAAVADNSAAANGNSPTATMTAAAAPCTNAPQPALTTTSAASSESPTSADSNRKPAARRVAVPMPRGGVVILADLPTKEDSR